MEPFIGIRVLDYARYQGYWWGGATKDVPVRTAKGVRWEGRATDPFAVRFARSGRQTLRLHHYESPMRVDAIWLSATQKTRPAADRHGPVGGAGGR